VFDKIPQPETPKNLNVPIISIGEHYSGIIANIPPNLRVFMKEKWLLQRRLYIMEYQALSETFRAQVTFQQIVSIKNPRWSKDDIVVWAKKIEKVNYWRRKVEERIAKTIRKVDTSPHGHLPSRLVLHKRFELLEPTENLVVGHYEVDPSLPRMVIDEGDIILVPT